MAATTTTVQSAGPVSGSRSFLDRLRDGDEIARLITFVFAAAIILITCLLVFQLWATPSSRVTSSASTFFVHQSLGSRLRRLRRAALYLRHARHRRGIAGHRRPAGHRRRHLSRRTRPRARLRHAAIPHRSSRRRSQRHLWSPRRLHRRSDDARIHSARAQQHSRFPPVFLGPRLRHRLPHGRHRPGHHGDSVHHLGLA